MIYIFWAVITVVASILFIVLLSLAHLYGRWRTKHCQHRSQCHKLLLSGSISIFLVVILMTLFMWIRSIAQKSNDAPLLSALVLKCEPSLRYGSRLLTRLKDNIFTPQKSTFCTRGGFFFLITQEGGGELVAFCEECFGSCHEGDAGYDGSAESEAFAEVLFMENDLATTECKEDTDATFACGYERSAWHERIGVGSKHAAECSGNHGAVCLAASPEYVEWPWFTECDFEGNERHDKECMHDELFSNDGVVLNVYLKK